MCHVVAVCPEGAALTVRSPQRLDYIAHVHSVEALARRDEHVAAQLSVVRILDRVKPPATLRRAKIFLLRSLLGHVISIVVRILLKHLPKFGPVNQRVSSNCLPLVFEDDLVVWIVAVEV